MPSDGILIDWCDSLWNFFLPEIQSGRPFYLAIDESVLLTTFPGTAAHLSVGGVEATFHKLCSDHLVIRGRFASLQSELLTPKPNGRSLALCLAAQQVLVVARMVEDANFSSDEYFPRLRSCMGLAPINANPFSFGEFLTIWRTLEQEILAVAGSSTSSITFKEVGGRKEKSRSLPLSQALLTQQDLSAIASAWNRERDPLDSANLLRLMDRSRPHLTRRGQRLCVLKDQRGKVVNQIRDFLRNPTVPIQAVAPTSIAPNTEPRSLLIFYQDFGLEERFVVRLLIGTTQQDSSNRLYEDVELRLRSSLFILFEDTGVHFKEFYGRRTIGAAEPIMLLARAQEQDALRQRFAQYPGTNSVEIIECDFSDKFVLLHIRNGFGVEVLSKALLGDNADQMPSEVTTIQFLGGFVIDGRNNTYLVGRTPTGIVANDMELSGADCVLLNGVELGVSRALEEISQTVNYGLFDIRYKDRSTVIRVSAYESDSLDRQVKLGFRAVDATHILPICENLGESEIGLTGVTFNALSQFKTKGIPRALLLSFIREPLSQWVPLTSQQLAAMDARLAATIAPAALKRLAATRSKLLRRIPAALLASI